MTQNETLDNIMGREYINFIFWINQFERYSMYHNNMQHYTLVFCCFLLWVYY